MAICLLSLEHYFLWRILLTFLGVSHRPSRRLSSTFPIDKFFGIFVSKIWENNPEWEGPPLVVDASRIEVVSPPPGSRSTRPPFSLVICKAAIQRVDLLQSTVLFLQSDEVALVICLCSRGK
ncbi:hypothetical protein TRIUR3_33385 [Triticum urartu]|uniref:Uncharacterized protein n=1 Tax=Triticum urartu TaxID=4572 RepID=M8AT92_TRIUA|nr:hypothetical protein TRIUR3_33385 [Triticum urartu]